MEELINCAGDDEKVIDGEEEDKEDEFTINISLQLFPFLLSLLNFFFYTYKSLFKVSQK